MCGVQIFIEKQSHKTFILCYWNYVKNIFNDVFQITCVILPKSSPGLGHGKMSRSWRLFKWGLRMSQGCEWHRGRRGCKLRLEEGGVLQTEVGDGDNASSKPEQPYGRAEAGTGWGGWRITVVFWIWTGDKEKRRCNNEWDIRGAGEEEHDEGAAKDAEQVPFNVSQGSHEKLQGKGESEDSAKLKKVGLDEEFSEDEVMEELGQRGGTELAPEPEVDVSPL